MKRELDAGEGQIPFWRLVGEKLSKNFQPWIVVATDKQKNPPKKKTKKKKKQQQPKSKRSRGPEGCGWFVVVQLNELKVGLDRVCV